MRRSPIDEGVVSSRSDHRNEIANSAPADRAAARTDFPPRGHRADAKRDRIARRRRDKSASAPPAGWRAEDERPLPARSERPRRRTERPKSTPLQSFEGDGRNAAARRELKFELRLPVVRWRRELDPARWSTTCETVARRPSRTRLRDPVRRVVLQRGLAKPDEFPVTAPRFSPMIEHIQAT
ncbi:MAG: hypothetical protein ACLQJL_04525 [Roseiarcus sp.]